MENTEKISNVVLQVSLFIEEMPDLYNVHGFQTSRTILSVTYPTI